MVQPINIPGQKARAGKKTENLGAAMVQGLKKQVDLARAGPGLLCVSRPGPSPCASRTVIPSL